MHKPWYNSRRKKNLVKEKKWIVNQCPLVAKFTFQKDLETKFCHTCMYISSYFKDFHTNRYYNSTQPCDSCMQTIYISTRGKTKVFNSWNWMNQIKAVVFLLQSILMNSFENLHHWTNKYLLFYHSTFDIKTCKLTIRLFLSIDSRKLKNIKELLWQERKT